MTNYIRSHHCMTFTEDAQTRIDLIAAHKEIMAYEIMVDAGDRKWITWGTTETIDRENNRIDISMQMEFEE